MLAYINWWGIFFSPLLALLSLIASKETAVPEAVLKVRARCSFLLMHSQKDAPC